MDHGLLKAVIADQWDLIQNVQIIPREYEFEPNANYVLTGLRRVGKSTLLYGICQQLIAGGTDWKQIIYINFEDERLAEFRLQDFNDIVNYQSSLTNKKGFFFLDEIQNISGWEKFARRMADMKERVFITGSNASMLSHEIESTLGGRYLSKYIMTYNFREYLVSNGMNVDSNDIYSTKESGRILGFFERYYTYGGFPESVAYRSKREYVSSVFQKVLLGDIVTRNKIRNEYAIKLLVKKVAESVCGDISFSKLHNALSGIGIKISKDSVIEYVSYAIQAYLIIPVPNFFAKFSEREGNQKYYFSDNGLLNLFLHDKPSALLENIVAVWLTRNSDEIYYLKSSKTGIDVDFYVPQRQLAIQVAYSIQGEARKREVNNLVKLSQQFSEVCRFLILTKNEQEHIIENGVEIEVMPVWRFLLNKW